MGRSKGRIWPLPPRTVSEDWQAWIPADKEELFAAEVNELEAGYSILSISLNEAFTLRRETALGHARKQLAVAVELLGRLCARIERLLTTVEQHSKHFGTVPNAAPLNPHFFRGVTAQRYSKRNALLGKVLFSSRSRYFHKLRLLVEVCASIQTEFSQTGDELVDGASTQPGNDWGELEVLHYDLNTCLREGMIMFKSFLCALPNGELRVFRQMLESAKDPSPAAKPLRKLGHRRATLL